MQYRTTKRRAPKRFFARNPVVILFLVIFFPVGLILMWKLSEWSKKTKWVVSAVFAALLVIGIWGSYSSPPSVTVANAKDNAISTDNTEYTISGDVTSMKAATLSINDQYVPLTEVSKFSHQVPLKEGDNTITLIATNENGEYKKVVAIHRTTKAEFSARSEAQKLASETRTQEQAKKEAEANAKADKEAKAKAADQAAKEKAKQAKEKAEKQKIAQNKAKEESKPKHRFALHWPFGKSDEAKAKEKAAQAKIAQDKITAAANARKALIDRLAPLYCQNRKSVKVVLSSEGKANGWPSNDGSGWAADQCVTIMSKLYDRGATEQELGLVADGKYAIGMLEMSLLYSVGSPRDINSTTAAGYKRSQYVYGDPLYNATYIYVENGIVTTVQN